MDSSYVLEDSCRRFESYRFEERERESMCLCSTLFYRRWTCFGQVYDVTDFLDDHPGGGESITICAGQDSSEEFNALHSDKARAMLEDYYIGELDIGEDKTEACRISKYFVWFATVHARKTQKKMFVELLLCFDRHRSCLSDDVAPINCPGPMVSTVLRLLSSCCFVRP